MFGYLNEIRNDCFRTPTPEQPLSDVELAMRASGLIGSAAFITLVVLMILALIGNPLGGYLSYSLFVSAGIGVLRGVITMVALKKTIEVIKALALAILPITVGSLAIGGMITAHTAAWIMLGAALLLMVIMCGRALLQEQRTCSALPMPT